MKGSDLPPLKLGDKGCHLRRLATSALNTMDTSARAYGGHHPDASSLAAFFEAAAAQAAKFIPDADKATTIGETK